MKIVIYCQHVLGVGHLFRTLEISRALNTHDVILVTGGSQIDTPLPSHVRPVELPPLMMDADFSALHTVACEDSLDQIKQRRAEALYDLFAREVPDLFIVELYPFGRKAFKFELDPVLTGLRSGALPPCRTACSLRDILVEKRNSAAYETRVIETLNRFFDVLLVHADPAILKLEETFSRMEAITIPVVYTGFVTPYPQPEAGKNLRRRLSLQPEDNLVVASAGGGKVGYALLEAVVGAVEHVPRPLRVHIFTGPFLDDDLYAQLERRQTNIVRVERFSSDFLAFLDAADLSISMAGYNTCMNILATRVPSLLWPFEQNREQRMRAERLARWGGIQVLDDADLETERLGRIMAQQLSMKERSNHQVDLNGAVSTANWIEEWMQ